MEALRDANVGHADSYGADPWTEKAVDRLRQVFDADCEVYFVLTGTAANSLALAAMCQPYHAVICYADAHIQTDECGCPEFLGRGLKLTTVAGAEGKLTPTGILDAVQKHRDVHSNKPSAISISQATEVGTVYSVAELQALAEVARELRLAIHMDGARLANALATLQVAPKEITWQVGVDVLCLGGTKNGIAVGDAIVFFNRDMAREFPYRVKQAGHLLSKMRLMTAPWAALLESGVWLENARHANRMAQYLEQKLREIPGIEIRYPVQANGVFVLMPPAWLEALHGRGWHFYNIAGAERLMCSWDTQPEDIDALHHDLREIVASVPS